ncbi:MAG: Ig-like domain-containing protein [Candidatus Woesearchaeota archaeon]|nr:Ig-like domain-containing protein [Candidatus Woesearchaeota archaeon]
MINFKTKSLIVLLVLSIFLLSSCEVYQTLYGNTTQGPDVQDNGDEETVDDDEDSEEDMEEETEEDVEEEVSDEEETEEEPTIIVVDEEKENPIVLVVQETDLISLIPKAEDPDRDDLTFTFTSPISDAGEWQTIYGDSGEYTITVTVSDGELATTRDVLIIVNKKEESPTIDSAWPIESGLVIDETESIDFSVVASDLNNDPLSYSWKLDGLDVGDDAEYTYQTTYDDAGTHTVKIDVSDGLSSASKIWSVEVRNVNRRPVLEDLDHIEVKETDLVIITALATDDDEDPVTYEIDDGRFEQEDNVFRWQTDYDSAGTYEVTVTASDGQDESSQTFTVAVENQNRPPVITDVLQKE